MSVTFAALGSGGSGGSGGSDVEIQNPDLEDVAVTERRQVVNFTADGVANVYSLGVKTERVRLRWSYMRDDEKTALETFFDDVADGCANEFSYTDHKGTGHTARLLTPKLEWTQMEDEDGSSGDETFTVGSATYPTTTRTGGTWSVSLELLLT